jgi:L-2-hydroxyglutarate oxidase
MKKIAIIGGGIVGVATAYQLLNETSDCEIILLEKENRVAAHQTGNNSGVIHSGIYYKPGSLKAKNCLRGYDFLIDFCKKHNIDYELCGKVIVAINEHEISALEKLYDRGNEHGLKGLKYLTSQEIKEIEPECTGVKGVFVPQTGIVDYKRVTEKLAEEVLQNSRASILLSSKVNAISYGDSRVNIAYTSPEGKKNIQVDYAINCAGLYCDKIAELSGEKLNVKIIPFRGEYYTVKPERAHIIKNLIYPVPDSNFPFLGVHFTRRITGEIEAGPNAVFAFKREGYKKTDFSASEFLESIFWRGFQKVAFKYWQTGIGEYYRSFSKRAFTKALQKLVPAVTMNDLEPAGAGVRAQACDKQGNLIDDFYIQESEQFIHVLNAPSPAATSSLSIGMHISDRAREKWGI